MLVQDRMTSDPVTITPDTTFNDAFVLMKKNKFRRLPVLTRGGRLVGIVVEKDLLRASPSSATSLSVYEINYLLSQLKVEQVMSHPVITTTESVPMEEAARLMIDKKIGCLPVVRDGQLVGIITETDIFKSLVETLGGGHRSVRITTCLPDRPGELARVAGIIAEAGGNIYSCSTFRSKRPDCLTVTMRVEGISAEKLRAAIINEGLPVNHLWESLNGH